MIIDHIPFDLEAEIVAVRNAKVMDERAASDARLASLAVFQRALREKEERADASAAAVAEMRMGGVL